MIVVDLQTFSQSSPNGNVTGVIFLELQEGEFPERGWSDFPVIILGWWTDELLQLAMPKRRQVHWRFMDGPFCVTLRKVERGHSSDSVSYDQLSSSLLDAAKRVISHCERHQIFSRDLETLRSNAQQLKANQSVQRTGASRSAQIKIRTSSAAGSRR
jgi:hypothetical protein